MQADQWKSTIEDAVKALGGKLDVLVNNAGSNISLNCVQLSAHQQSAPDSLSPCKASQLLTMSSLLVHELWLGLITSLMSPQAAYSSSCSRTHLLQQCHILLAVHLSGHLAGPGPMTGISGSASSAHTLTISYAQGGAVQAWG